MTVWRWDIRRPGLPEVLPLIKRCHGYGNLGDVAESVFAVYERESPIAVYVWNPPAPGAAKAVCPEAPYGVLALTRMVAVPKRERERELPHISKPLRFIMRWLLDRGRWPVLVTYSDSSLGHDGNVYKCSGWQKDGSRIANVYENAAGERRSTFRAGRTNRDGLIYKGTTTLTRWVHRACTPGDAANHISHAGWRRIETRRIWRSGNPAGQWVKTP